MSSKRKNTQKPRNNSDKANDSVYNSALESLSSSPSIASDTSLSHDRSLTDNQFSPISQSKLTGDFLTGERNHPSQTTTIDKNKNNESLSTKFDALRLDDSNDSSLLNDSTATTVTITPNTTSDATFYTDSNYSISDYTISDQSLDDPLNTTILNTSSDTNSSDSNISAAFDRISKDFTPPEIAISGDAEPNNAGVNNLEEIVVISSEDESTIGRTDEDSDTGNTSYDKANTVLSNKPDETDPLSTSTTGTAASTTTGTFEITDNIKMYKSIEEFDKDLPPTVTLLKNDFGSKVYIVGTAHFSKESQDDVSLVIRNVRPEIVMVELCSSRIHMLNHDEKTLLEEARDISYAKIRSITKTNGVVNGLFYILMLNMSAKITQDLGMAPGGEFRRAVEEMHRLPNPILHLGDRSINITLQRAFNGLSLWQTIKIVCKLIFSNKTITKEEVEQCKQKDLLEELMQQMAGEYPVFRDVFVTERDLYLCHSLTIAALPQNIDELTGKPKPVTVVGVVGIGHAAGIAKNWGKVDESQLPSILTIPPASLSNRIFKCTVKYGVLTLAGYGIYKLIRPRIQSLF